MVWWFVFCLVVAVFAYKRGRSAVGWFILSVFISPLIAGIALAMSKDLSVDDKVENVERRTDNIEQEVKFNQKYNDLRSSYMQKEIDSNRNLAESALISHTNKPSFDNQTSSRVNPPSLMNQSNPSGVIKCPNCGTKLDHNYLFCPLCGTKLINKCTNCGEEVPFNATFCPHCGQRLINTNEVNLSYNKIHDLDKNTEKIPSEELSDTNSSSENSFLSLVLVEKGQFFMGDVNEGNKCELTYDFSIRKLLTTFDDFDRYCESSGKTQPHDQGWGRKKRPVINVSWIEAIEYCNWLSETEGLPCSYNFYGSFLDENGNVTKDVSKVIGYRLPTEAEWEYAAKGGSKTNGYKYAGSNYPDEVAWYDLNSGKMTHEVGRKEPNELGIYDMSGNVWEWCSDWYGDYSSLSQTNPYNNSGSSMVLHGGSWINGASYVRPCVRFGAIPATTDSKVGFRVCRTIFE